MSIKRYIFLLSIAVVASSCQKFLDVKPKGIILPEKIGDYEAILNSPSLTKHFPANLLHFTDDYFSVFDAADHSVLANAYYWRPVITENEQASPDIWGPLYRSIYAANVIINGAAKASGGTDSQKKSVQGEALCIRAMLYLDLLTVFAKAYDPATADNDPGLPLVTSTDVNDQVPARSSVQATLDSLLSDVHQALEHLPISNLNHYRITRHTAHAMLARIYLYMADYPNAEKHTELALEAPHSLLDYNNFAAPANAPTYDANPEVLWQRAGISGTPIFMPYSDDLKSHFTPDDLRYVLLTVTSNNGLGRNSFPGVYSFGISFPEMYLTQAELLARAGHHDEAMDIVNKLRKTRLTTAAYTDQSAETSEEALAKVFAERRRELAFCGLRWFDMKRLDREGRMPEIQRINPENQTVDASLKPNSPHYTFEIPVRVSLFNPGMQLNHE